jgi:hypothetical protein
LTISTSLTQKYTSRKTSPSQSSPLEHTSSLLTLFPATPPDRAPSTGLTFESDYLLDSSPILGISPIGSQSTVNPTPTFIARPHTPIRLKSRSYSQPLGQPLTQTTPAPPLTPTMLFTTLLALLPVLPVALGFADPELHARSRSRMAHRAILDKRQSFGGRATFYDVGLGACGGYKSVGRPIHCLCSR